MFRAYGKSVKSYTAWVAETAYELTDYRVPTVDNSWCYECTTAGTSGETQPTWTKIVNATVADGTVVWTCRAKAEEANALSVTLAMGDTGGYSLKDVWMKSDGNVTFAVQVSYSGLAGTWRELDSKNVNDTEALEQYQTPYSFIRVSTATSAANEIEIIAGQV